MQLAIHDLIPTIVLNMICTYSCLGYGNFVHKRMYASLILHIVTQNDFPACKFCIRDVRKVSELQEKYSIPRGNFFAKTYFAESKIMSFRFRYVEVTLYVKPLTPVASFFQKKDRYKTPNKI